METSVSHHKISAKQRKVREMNKRIKRIKPSNDMKKVIEQKVQETNRLKENEKIRLINSWVKNFVNMNFFRARSNMIVDQLNKGVILEKVDGALKSKEYITAEMLITKNSEISCNRQLKHDRNELEKNYNFKEEDFQSIVEKLYTGTLPQEDADIDRKAKFVAE